MSSAQSGQLRVSSLFRLLLRKQGGRLGCSQDGGDPGECGEVRAQRETPKSLGPVPAQGTQGASGTADLGMSKDGKRVRAAQTRERLQVPGTLMSL